MILINTGQEADAGLYALRVLSGNAGLSAALQSDRQVEGLVALSLEILDRDVPPDFHAALELYAHLAKDIDLRLNKITSFSKRKDGIPFISIPPGRLSFSNTVTS